MADTKEAIHHKVVVAGVQAFVGEAVDEEVDAGMQVRNHWCVQVNWERKLIPLVRQQNYRIRRPAYAEDEKDNEDDLDLPDGLHDGCLTVPGFQTAAAAMVPGLKNPQLSLADVREDAPVAKDNDNKR